MAKSALQEVFDLIGSIMNNLAPANIQKPAYAASDPSQMKLTYGKSSSTLSDASIQPAMPTTISQTQGNLDFKELERKMRAGLRAYNNGQPLPIEEHIPTFIQASQKYPVFTKHPYLLPAVSLVETSGGKNWQLYHNPLSWAARVQMAGNYNPASSAQSINDMITAVGGDQNRGAGYPAEIAASRVNQIRPYQKFRDSGNLQDFTTTYETPDSNPNYHRDVSNFIQMFEKQ